jgi:glycerol-3-phosphate dehydrogenase (NAD(P)+)
LHTSLKATTSIKTAVHDADVIVMGVPSHSFRHVLAEAAPHIRPWVPIVSFTKGIEQGTRMRRTEIIESTAVEAFRGFLRRKTGSEADPD